MGLLDQAIREHLELKRQHGADPGELARLEREALGPPVRETQEVLAAAAGAASTTRTAPATSTHESEPWAEESPGQAASSATAPFDAEAEEVVDRPGAIAPEGTPAPAEPAPAEPAPAETSHPAAAEPSAAPAEPSPAEPSHPAAADPSAAPDEATPPDEDLAAPAAPEPTAGEPAVEDSPAEGEAKEDVLEETPEFLQETPEHDRLWFEQKPPRDFDFDD
jgi:hypothetical protein